MGSGQSATVADTSYYDLLGVEPTVSSADLQKAYRKKALRLHPDKGGDPDKFKEMKDVYDVLLNPEKRAAYDRYGPMIVGVMNGEAPTLDVMAAMLDKLTFIERAKFVSMVVFVASFVLSSPIMFALRWDGTTRESWAFVFLPLWLMEAAAVGLVLLPIPAPEDPEDAEAQEEYELMRKMKKERGLCALVPAATQALLAAKLEGSFGDDPGSWAIVFCPFILLECLWLVGTVRSKQAWAPWAWGAARLVAWVLVATRASGIWHGSWLWCLAPLLSCELLQCRRPLGVGVGSQVRLRGLSQAELNGKLAQVVSVEESGRIVVQPIDESSGQLEIDESGQPRRVSVRPEKVGRVGCCSCLSWLPWLVVGALKLDGWSASAFLMLIPVLVPVFCLTCAFSCGICAITGEMVRRADQDPAQQEAREDGDGPAAASDVPYNRMPAEP